MARRVATARQDEALIADEELAADAAMAFLQIAIEAKELGEKDIVVMALRRTRMILQRRLQPEDQLK